MDKEFQNYKQKQHTSPESKLHSEVLSLTHQKIELEKQLQKVTEKKREMKEKYVKAELEIQKLKQAQVKENEDRLKRDQRELETTRLRYISHESKRETDSNRNYHNSVDDKTNFNSFRFVENYDPEIERLTKEKDDLLRYCKKNNNNSQ